ncbi:hypothetical protein BD408DRAFT_417850 [Parasitella parasitica]|nr:hypothetical protein BD408DRAFT_417850 [Parasitella parasitica]
MCVLLALGLSIGVLILQKVYMMNQIKIRYVRFQPSIGNYQYSDALTLILLCLMYSLDFFILHVCGPRRQPCSAYQVVPFL